MLGANRDTIEFVSLADYREGARLDWMGILSSAVTAAIITAIVALIGALVSSTTAKSINHDRINLDRELAEQKANAELALARSKTALDRQLSLSKRRAEIAEKVLSDFYRIRRAFQIIRSPMIWAAEMIPEEGVQEDIIRNDGYGVTRRFRQYESLFSEVEASRFTFSALFGANSAAAYDAIIRAHNQVFHAAQDILRYRHEGANANLAAHLRAMRRIAFSLDALDEEGRDVPDSTAARIDEAVALIEAICRPALESEVAAEAAGREC